MALDHPRGPRPAGPPAAGEADPARLTGDRRLPCGRPVAQAWAEARSRHGVTDPHTAHCPHCRQAVAGLTALDAATAELTREPPGARLVAERVMRSVHAEVRLGRPLPLDDPTGDLRVSTYTAAKILRRAADTVPGARAVGCRLTPHEDGSVTVAMTLAAALDAPLPHRTDRVRRAVTDAATRRLGLRLTEVDLRVIAVLGTTTPAGSPR